MSHETTFFGDFWTRLFLMELNVSSRIFTRVFLDKFAANRVFVERFPLIWQTCFVFIELSLFAIHLPKNSQGNTHLYSMKINFCESLCNCFDHIERFASIWKIISQFLYRPLPLSANLIYQWFGWYFKLLSISFHHYKVHWGSNCP